MPEHDLQRAQPLLIRHCTKTLGGSLRTSVVEGDDSALVQGLKRDLEASGADKAKTDKFLELCNRLNTQSGKPGVPSLPPRVRTGLLRLLRKLASTGRPVGGSSIISQLGVLQPAYPVAAAPLQQQQQLPYPYLGNTAGGQYASQQHASHSQPHYAQQHPQQQQHPLPPPRPPQRQNSATSFNGSVSGLGGAGLVRPTSVITPSEMGDDPAVLMGEVSRMSIPGGLAEGDFFDRRNFSAASAGLGGGAGVGGGAAVDALVAAGSGTRAPSQPQLVQGVLYAARGVSSALLQWAEEGGDAGSGFRLRPDALAAVGPGRAALVAVLTELGWAYRRVRAAAQASGHGSASVREALGSALNAELGDFFKLLALLEAQAGCPLPTPGDVASAGGSGGGGGQYLTLIRLRAWLAEPTLRMRHLAALAEMTELLEGGALADAVHEYSLHGDPFVRNYVGRLLRQVCVPLYGMIRSWVLQGELNDPYDEFFVVPVPPPAATAAAAADGLGAPAPVDVWRSSYAVDQERLPRFIEEGLARRILRAGKAIHYLKMTCDDERWVLRRADEWAAARRGLDAGGEGEGSAEEQLAGLESLVGSAVRSVDERLLSVLWGRHRLRAHWAAIRRFVLLGQGDWVTAFLDLVDADGVQPVLATLLRLRAEMGHFATNLQLYIQFDVMEASWQDFYSRAASCADLDSLIAAHEAHLAKLLRKALLQDDAAQAQPPQPPPQGGQGQAQAQGGPSAAAMRRALQDMLSNMVALRAVAGQLEELVEGGARLHAKRRAEAAARVAKGGWGTTATAGGTAGGSGEPVVSAAALADIARTLAELRAQHQRAVAEFTDNLAEEAQDDMRFLLARLDFSAKGVQAGATGPPSGAPGQLRL
ncbi:GCP3 protein [Gonium pectorale]|uniref:GCP3 protein n=1 Tax=Gonium pectorale TaxID=33097 RepID=A0A150GJT2_GONPE|nr:GCP3 protein [Gonium pectorale]|eukprot:KXZ50079.1 GCP3 protein [Gonium pectorale]